VQILNTSNVLLQTLYIYTATSSTTIHQTGWVNHVANLTAYGGQTIRIRFSATYNYPGTAIGNGPGRAEVDAVSVQTTAPTAASVSVSGRLLTSDGAGISRANVTLTNSAGVSHSATSSSFGYYRFDDVPAGETYVLTVNNKKYLFADSPRIVNVQESLADIDFIASP
jgi:hypothetical protein